VRKVVDFVDVDSEKWRQYAERRSWPMSWIYRREGERLLDFEREVASSAHASLFVTGDEAGLFRRRAGLDARIWSVLNGVDTGYFSPAEAIENPYASGGPVIVFTGAMDYWANVDAVTWFAREVFPSVRSRVPGARFVIVGARPTREVRKLRSLDGVEVTGRVKDVRPYLAHAALAVAPLRVARGIQNKVLEAMAMARAVVASPAAVEGLAIPDELRGYVAESRGDFAEAVVALLLSAEAREPVGAANREWVLEHHDWSETLKPLEELIENGAPHGRA
jgi:sugar transferase (PEP-CTERM/EpsH1 system associated)